MVKIKLDGWSSRRSVGNCQTQIIKWETMEHSGKTTASCRSSGNTPTLTSALQIFSVRPSTSHKAQLLLIFEEVTKVYKTGKLTSHAGFWRNAPLCCPTTCNPGPNTRHQNPQFTWYLRVLIGINLIGSCDDGSDRWSESHLTDAAAKIPTGGEGTSYLWQFWSRLISVSLTLLPGQCHHRGQCR